MKFYSVTKDNNFIGIINSHNFIRYDEIQDIYLPAGVPESDFFICKNKMYRTSWMKPLNPNIKNLKKYEVAIAKEISEEEYKTLLQAMEKNEVIEVEEEIPEYKKYVPYKENITLDFMRESKLQEMSYACRTIIESGFDIILRDEPKHFSLDTQDQLNLMSLSTMAQTQDSIPYHADGELCIFYTAAEINEIVETATAWKVYHTTYYNTLKNYINTLDTIEEIAAIEYGVEIPDEYKSDVLKVLEE